METTLADRLLVYLRAKLGAGVAFDLPPTELTGGFDATTMAFRLSTAPPEWTGDLVLRLMSFVASAVRVRREAATHAALVEAGYPAPRILLAEVDGDVLGKPFLIMERLAGRTMWEGIVGKGGRISRLFVMPRRLAELHARLHRVPGEALLAKARDYAVDADLLTLGGEVHRLQRRIDEAGIAGLRPGAAWLVQHLPPPAQPEVICHGDFHPLNILTEGDRITGVIDWPQAIVAEPAYDVAATRVLGRFANPHLPTWLHGPLALARLLILRRYMRVYRSLAPLDERNMPYFEAMRVLSALVFAGERPTPDNPWNQPRIVAALYRHFEGISGVRVQI